MAGRPCFHVGCTSGYDSRRYSSAHLFKIPMTATQEVKNCWIQNIPKQVHRIFDLSKDRLCSLHFEEKYIVKHLYIIYNGEKIPQGDRKHWTLTSDAIPTKFVNEKRLKNSLNSNPLLPSMRMSESVMYESSEQSQSNPDAFLQTETLFTDGEIDIKYEIGGSDPDPEPDPDQRPVIINEGKQPDDIEFNFLQNLNDHVKVEANHSPGGQPICDPVLVQVPYETEHSLANAEIKCEVEDVETMECGSETELVLETWKKYESDIRSDREAIGTRKSFRKQRRKQIFAMKDPLRTDAGEKSDSCTGASEDYSESRKSQNSKERFLKTQSGETNDNDRKCEPTTTQKYQQKLKRFRKIVNKDPSKTETEGATERTQNEKPYSCGFCCKRFSRTTTLKKHMKKIHGRCEKIIHTGQNPYKCDECEKRFTVKSYLIVHKRTHTGDRPYECQVCWRTFTRSNSLAKHKRMHTGEKPYECDECETRFTTSYGRARHKRSHHKK